MLEKPNPGKGCTTPRLGNGGAELCHPEKQPFSYEKEQGLHTEGHTEGRLHPGFPQGKGCKTQSFHKERLRKRFPRAFKNKAHSTPKPCPEHARIMPTACQNHAKSMPLPGTERIRTRPKACQNHARLTREPVQQQSARTGSHESRSGHNLANS